MALTIIVFFVHSCHGLRSRSVYIREKPSEIANLYALLSGVPKIAMMACKGIYMCVYHIYKMS